MSDNNELWANAADAAPRHSATPEPVSRIGPDGRVSAFAAHTPGPWDYERAADPRDVDRPWVGRLAENRFAALACGENANEAWANARLIAAAPELYAAAYRMMEIVAARPKLQDDDEVWGAFTQCVAATRKARGDAA